VVTAYHTARDTLSFLRKHEWECLIIDEGHAVKNDRSELSLGLGAVRAHHRVILTGTPLQNNIRELFNIMQYGLFKIPLTVRFLDPKNFNSEKLEEKYQELDEVKVREIHEMLRYFPIIPFLTIAHVSFVEQKPMSSNFRL
jgi:chromodomain-helicase-DNA-binding protein 4